MSRSTLLIFAHGSPQASKINQQLLALARKLPGVCIHDISSAYPDYRISLERELALLARHDNIGLQFPLYWYSMPAILKAWLDAVFLAPALLAKGGVIAGKSIKALATAGSDLGLLPVSQGFAQKSIFWPIEQTTHHLEMQWLQPKMLNHVSRWSDVRLACETDDYIEWLSSTRTEPCHET